MMVGTTVILSAAVYTWTSTYANLPTQGVRILALASEGPAEGGDKAFVVSAVMPGVSYGDLNLTLGGRHLSLTAEEGCPAPARGEYAACRGNATLRMGDEIFPGDRIRLSAERGNTLRIVDAHAGFVVFTTRVD